MGSIAPKSNTVFKATLSGVTDGKDDPFINGVELQFVVRVRVADERETMKTVELTRRVQR
jgi:hypothetical protein